MRELMDAIKAVGTGAAAVSVVNEDVVVPSTGETRFSTSFQATPHDDLDDMPKRSKAPLIVVAAIALAAIGGGAAWALSGDGGTTKADDTKTDAAVVQPADPPPTEPDEANEADDGAQAVAAPALPSKVSITVAAEGVEGTVHDERDDALLGKLNEPFEVAYGTDSRGLYVRAEGYEDQLASVIPDADKQVPVSMSAEEVEATPAGGNVKKTKKRPKKVKKATPPSSNVDTSDPPKKKDPPPKGPDKKNGGSTSPDLKNPFNRGG
jgi:serine/threonine-protein kinase